MLRKKKNNAKNLNKFTLVNWFSASQKLPSPTQRVQWASGTRRCTALSLTLFHSFLMSSSVATTPSADQAKEGAAVSQPIRCSLWPRTRHQSSFPAGGKSRAPDNAAWPGRERWPVDSTAASIIFFQSRNTESHCLDQWYSYVTLCKGRHLHVQKINNKHSNHIFLIHYTKLEE